MNLHHATMYGPLEFPMPATSSTNGSASTSSGSSSSTDSSNNVLDASSFMTLLTTELQSQDPTDPISPTDMINQLAELDSLTELAAMRQDLDTLAGNASQAATDSLRTVQEPAATALRYLQQQNSPQTAEIAKSLL